MLGLIMRRLFIAGRMGWAPAGRLVAPRRLSVTISREFSFIDLSADTKPTMGARIDHATA
jgi:hypothetical protein